MVQVGSGTKLHFATRYEIEGKGKFIFTACNAHSIRGLRVLAQLDLFDFIQNPKGCENCVARATEELEKVGA
jgi:hypothetical protein